MPNKFERKLSHWLDDVQQREGRQIAKKKRAEEREFQEYTKGPKQTHRIIMREVQSLLHLGVNVPQLMADLSEMTQQKPSCSLGYVMIKSGKYEINHNSLELDSENWLRLAEGGSEAFKQMLETRYPSTNLNDGREILLSTITFTMKLSKEEFQPGLYKYHGLLIEIDENGTVINGKRVKGWSADKWINHISGIVKNRRRHTWLDSDMPY